MNAKFISDQEILDFLVKNVSSFITTNKHSKSINKTPYIIR